MARGAARPAIVTLKARRDFLAAASRGHRWSTPGLVVQGRARAADELAAAPVRIGYTCSKKVGNAVARNRAKRRLRAAVAAVAPEAARPGWDYVLVGLNAATAARPFPLLLADLRAGLDRLHSGRASRGGPPRAKGKAPRK